MILVYNVILEGVILLKIIDTINSNHSLNLFQMFLAEHTSTILIWLSVFIVLSLITIILNVRRNKKYGFTYINRINIAAIVVLLFCIFLSGYTLKLQHEVNETNKVLEEIGR